MGALERRVVDPHIDADGEAGGERRHPHEEAREGAVAPRLLDDGETVAHQPLDPGRRAAERQHALRVEAARRGGGAVCERHRHRRHEAVLPRIPRAAVHGGGARLGRRQRQLQPRLHQSHAGLYRAASNGARWRRRRLAHSSIRARSMRERDEGQRMADNSEKEQKHVLALLWLEIEREDNQTCADCDDAGRSSSPPSPSSSSQP